MRFQRGASGFLHRFTDLTSSPERLEFSPFVFPVVVLGQDSIDEERRRFTVGGEVTAAAGNVPRVVIAARLGPIELLELAVRRPGAGNRVIVDAKVIADELLGTPLPSSNGAAFSSTALAGSLGFIGGPADESTWLPVRGWILELGEELEVRAETGGSTLSWWACWRNVGELGP